MADDCDGDAGVDGCGGAGGGCCDAATGDCSRTVVTRSRRTSIGQVFCNCGGERKWGFVAENKLIKECDRNSPSAGVCVVVVIWQGISFGAMFADIGTGGTGTHQQVAAGRTPSGTFYATSRGQRGTLLAHHRAKESCALLL